MRDMTEDTPKVSNTQTSPDEFSEKLRLWNLGAAGWLCLAPSATYDFRHDTDDGYLRFTWGSLDREEPKRGHWRGWHIAGSAVAETRFTGSVLLSDADRADLVGAIGEPPSMFTPEQELALRELGRGTDEAR